MANRKETAAAAVLTALSVFSTVLFSGFRLGFVFVDHVLFDGFCYVLWSIFILNTVVLFFQLRGCLTAGRLYRRPVLIVNGIVTGLSVIVCLAFLITGGANELRNYMIMAGEIAPYLILGYLFLLFALVVPVCSRLFQRLAAGITAAAVAVTALVAVFPAGGFSFESAPAVFDDGTGYRVVFATNRDSVGCVVIENGGEETVLWDTVTGRKESCRVHSVYVPYEQLNGKEYSVRALRTVENIAYGGHLGKQIDQPVGTFAPCPEDGFDMVCVTDNHGCSVDWEQVGENADLAVFLGDIANGLYSADSYVDNLLVPAGRMTGGVIPVLYARGNHDHRGGAVPEFVAALDFDAFYYQTQIGSYTFTVLDSGEDKEDGNYEYAGYNDYASYTARQIQWLGSLEKNPGYHVAIVHAPELFYTPEGESPAAGLLRELGADLLVSGHWHQCEWIPADESESGINTCICGSQDGMHNLRYTRMHFDKGAVEIQFLHTNGQSSEWLRQTLTKNF